MLDPTLFLALWDAFCDRDSCISPDGESVDERCTLQVTVYTDWTTPKLGTTRTAWNLLVASIPDIETIIRDCEKLAHLEKALNKKASSTFADLP